MGEIVGTSVGKSVGGLVGTSDGVVVDTDRVGVEGGGIVDGGVPHSEHGGAPVGAITGSVGFGGSGLGSGLGLGPGLSLDGPGFSFD